MSAPRPPAFLVARLKDALARQKRANDELTTARRDEAQVLAELQALQVSWPRVASRLAPIPERHRLAEQLRLRAWRRGVSRCNGNRAGDGQKDPVRAGQPAPAASPSLEEVTMAEKLIRRTVIEEFVKQEPAKPAPCPEKAEASADEVDELEDEYEDEEDEGETE